MLFSYIFKDNLSFRVGASQKHAYIVVSGDLTIGNK